MNSQISVLVTIANYNCYATEAQIHHRFVSKLYKHWIIENCVHKIHVNLLLLYPSVTDLLI